MKRRPGVFARPGRSDRPRVHRFQAHAARRHRLGAPRPVRDRDVAARGGAADQGADDRRHGRDARILREGGRGARHAADGEAALGDPRRRVHLLDVARRLRPRHRALQGRRGHGAQRREADAEAPAELRPDPARRLDPADQGPDDRRRADPRAHVPQRPLRPSHPAPPGRAGGRRGQAGAAGGRDHAHRRRPAPDPRAARSRQAGLAQSLPGRARSRCCARRTGSSPPAG